MTRAVVFLSITLAAASLGVFAQDVSGKPPSQNAASSPTSTQTTTNSAAQTKVPVPQNSSASAQNSQNPPQSGVTPATSAPTQSIQQNNAAAAQDPQGAARQLPQTSTILPLLGLIGLGSLVAGLFARR